MNHILKLPVGIENFEKLRTEDFYYVDKTGFIKELLDNWGKVNLFTRPRRFGKSVNMKMLQYFFEYGCQETLFEGLAISSEKEYCEKYMGKFPVIFITLKDVSASNFEEAKAMLRNIVGREAMRFYFLSESSTLSREEKEQYKQIIKSDSGGKQKFSMPDDVLTDSLYTLSEFLRKHYEQKVILLIDEYDVPLDKARQYDYYDEMVLLIRNLFGQVLKTNDNLYFAVLTGCLRIAKESIFTGLNHMKIFSVTDIRFASRFGFTPEEVHKLLDYYNLKEKMADIQKWYDGYCFGNIEVYCPWDVINYIDLLLAEPTAAPRAFWINTSGNEIVRKFIQMATPPTRRAIEALIAGEYVAHRVNQELTYRELYSSIDNLWSVLFTTGYLTQRGWEEDENHHLRYRLVIPNLEIRQIFTDQIQEWFQEEIRQDTPGLDAFCASFLKAEDKTVEERFNAWLRKTISIRDTGVRKTKKENFYHGILLGLLSHREDWLIVSNAESGEGYSDILAEAEDDRIGIVIEIKYAEDGDLERSSLEALAQIDAKGYKARLRQDGMEKIIKYGIACYKKRCRVRAEV